ncbi:NifB/NifX family molybdenum-iron cluster-binding protein [Dysosmobacter sp.]|uniref:NifB/NifX family molybdenum-iron cluster-binding protein n=1 Tax=Dysosmobacter sp. TaxID=2591382 RepID=UPI003A8D8144
MKIAVTYENGNVFQHFGHTAQFKLYDVENGAVVSSQVVDTNGSGHGALAGLLAQQGVDCLICGGIGGGAQMALAQAGIRLYAGCSGDADQRVAELLNGTLQFAQEATCDHHHGEDHACGDHGCGHHSEGHSCGHTC